MNIETIGRFELASRIVLDEGTGSWFVVGISSDGEPSLLGEEIESIADGTVTVQKVDSRDSLIESASASEIIVLVAAVELEALSLDEARSKLQRDNVAALVLPLEQASRIASVAPHFTSWIGNRVFSVEDDRYLDDATRNERLEHLREHFGMADEEFVERIERHALQVEPEHLEWLVLLDRQDLLETL